MRRTVTLSLLLFLPSLALAGVTLNPFTGKLDIKGGGSTLPYILTPLYNSANVGVDDRNTLDMSNNGYWDFIAGDGSVSGSDSRIHCTSGVGPDITIEKVGTNGGHCSVRVDDNTGQLDVLSGQNAFTTNFDLYSNVTPMLNFIPGTVAPSGKNFKNSPVRIGIDSRFDKINTSTVANGHDLMLTAEDNTNTGVGGNAGGDVDIYGGSGRLSTGAVNISTTGGRTVIGGTTVFNSSFTATFTSALNGSPASLSFGNSADSPTGQEGVMRIDVISNGSNAGNIQPLSINGYNNGNPFILLTSWSGPNAASPGIRNSSILFGATASGIPFIQGPAGFAVQSFGGGPGAMTMGNLAVGYISGLPGVNDSFVVGDFNADGEMLHISGFPDSGDLLERFGDINGDSNGTLLTLDDANQAFHFWADTASFMAGGNIELTGGGQFTTNGVPVGLTVSTYSVSGVYNLTTTTQTIAIASSSSTITLASSGTYRIDGMVNLRYFGATFASNAFVTLNLYRQNNAPGVILNSQDIEETGGGITTVTNQFGKFPLSPIFYTTTNTNDVISLRGSLSAPPGAGNLQATSASLVATRLY